MSFISDIKLNRVDLALARHDPIQLSDNLQLTLNSYNELAIVEPRFPSYHNAINKSRHRTVLNTKEIFSTGSILYSEAVGNLPVGRFKDVVFKDGDEFYNITAQEPIIVEQKWSTINPNTRDCLLGVLFSTGEMLVLGRENHNQIYNYKVKVNVFEALAKLYEIPFFEGKWYVSAEEFKRLRLKYFAFYGSELAVVDLTNRITIFDFDLNVVKQVDFAKEIAKLFWEKNTLLVIGRDNSISVVKDDVKEIHPAQRGHFQKAKIVQYQEDILVIVVFMSKVVVLGSGGTHEFDTETWNTCTSIIAGRSKQLSIVLAYEDSTILTLSFDGGNLSKIPNDLSWAMFKERVLNRFQMSFEGGSIEGSIILHGVEPITDNILGVVYKVLPKNAIHFRIPSEISVNLSFFQLESSIGQLKDTVVNTSIAKLACFYLENFATIPVVIDDLTMSHLEKVDVFVPQLQVFVNEVLQPKELPEPTTEGTLQVDLIKHFVQNEAVVDNQFKICLARLLLSALGQFETPGNGMTGELYKRVHAIHHSIEHRIRNYIIQLLHQVAQRYPVENETDRFSLIAQGLRFGLKLSESEAKIKVGTNLVEEFSIDSKAELQTNSNNMIMSTSGHSWTTCDVTALPIVDRKTKIDELGNYKYLYGDQNSPIVDTLRHTIDFCYISGNRTYIGQF
ncbi:hypothetical protein KGF57_003131 [Candida theae]|uniref:Transcription factor IIIC 90kDa subunit N-terminal domain-containing protein n=1 Tax=Candida theae TaxID=1198502 RepID=A0AAD5BDC4_9ASCO|nr:uncharacterized protein KGF57_003131 [Candida theae]KAI5957437.1 hypothetical protein KGF57_003131 [Candida theae]